MLTAVLLIFLTSCALIESDAGKARYTYTYEAPDGTKHTIELKNAKDIGEVVAEVEYKGARVTLYEKGVNASTPMTMMAETNSKLAEKLMDMIP